MIHISSIHKGIKYPCDKCDYKGWCHTQHTGTHHTSIETYSVYQEYAKMKNLLVLKEAFKKTFLGDKCQTSSDLPPWFCDICHKKVFFFEGFNY